MVGGAAGWERAGRLDGGWRCWLGESGTAAWWVALLVGRERDGSMVGGAAGWERAGRLNGVLLISVQNNVIVGFIFISKIKNPMNATWVGGVGSMRR